MNRTRTFAPALLLIAACGGGDSDPDAALPTIDAPSTPDAPPTADAAPDAAPPLPDANPACGADQMCLLITPVDGVTTLPAGRIAVAWTPPEGSSLDVLEVAYDAVWPGDQVTAIDLATITAPSAPYLYPPPPFCPATTYAIALVVVSTDPDGDGAITAQEIQTGLQDGTIYGVAQDIAAYFTASCAPMPPEFPDGFLSGVHYYTLQKPVMILDGVVSPMSTCDPQTLACENLNPPL